MSLKFCGNEGTLFENYRKICHICNEACNMQRVSKFRLQISLFICHKFVTRKALRISSLIKIVTVLQIFYKKVNSWVF